MRYKVNTKFVFEGYFEIEADNRNEAKRLVGENCGLVMGGNIHTNLDDEEVDWNEYYTSRYAYRSDISD